MIHDTIKQRLRASLLLTPPPKQAHAAALRHAAALQPDGTWADLPPPASLPPGAGKPAHLERTLLLAKAHRTAAGALDDALRRALDAWLSNDSTGPDWRDNQIVIPRLVGEIALLYDNGLSAGAAGKVMEILARSRWARWEPSHGWVDQPGMDLLGIAYNHLLRGCLENAPTFFDAAFTRIFREVRQAVPGEEGIQADMTLQVLPGKRIGGGFTFMCECAQFLALSHGTPWQAPAETVRLFANFLLDGQQWMMRPGTVDTEPPNDVFSEGRDFESMAAAVHQLAQLGNPPRRSELVAFSHRLQGRAEALFGHRFFWRARMSVHQRPAFYASVRLAALPNVADGQTYFLRSGREYHGLDFSAAADFRPGTTTFLAAAGGVPDCPDSAGTDATLAGGVSEGECGLAVSRLVRPGLRGNKAWFFFDESVVCLGAGLDGTSVGRPAVTTINHCRRQGPVSVRFADGGTSALTPGEDHAPRAVCSVEHDGISYIFPVPASVLVRFGGQEGQPASAPESFRMQLDHGALSGGAAWTCLVLPTGDDPEAVARVGHEVGCVEVLVNSPAVQAARHSELRLLGAAFWEPGVVLLPGGGRVAANHACLLLCRDLPGGGTRLSISNLGDKASTVHVEYGGQCVCFDLPGGPDAGRGVSRLL